MLNEREKVNVCFDTSTPYTQPWFDLLSLILELHFDYLSRILGRLLSAAQLTIRVQCDACYTPWAASQQPIGRP